MGRQHRPKCTSVPVTLALTAAAALIPLMILLKKSPISVRFRVQFGKIELAHRVIVFLVLYKHLKFAHEDKKKKKKLKISFVK